MDKFIGWCVGWLTGIILGFSLAFLTPKCKAQELYTIATVKSYHQDRSAGYNEKNYGIGLELHLNSDWKTIVGEYRQLQCLNKIILVF